jgi:hypothetical protein
MRRIVLLLGICFCISGLYAQKLETNPLDDGDNYEIRIKNFDKLFGERFTQENLAPLPADKAEQRETWRNECAGKLLTAELKQALKKIGNEEGGGFWITFYFDKEGKVLTVKFMMSVSVYINLSTKTLKALYNLAMQEKMNPENYSFITKHAYAVDGFELMKRAIWE